MIAAVIALYLLNKTKFDVIPRIKTLFTDFIIPWNTTILAKSDEAGQTTKPTTEMKKKELNELVMAIVMLQSPLKSYAASIGDLVLKSLAGRTQKQLERLKLNEVETTCKAIIDKATDLQTELAPFGLTEDMLTVANDKLTIWKVWYTATVLKKGGISSSKDDVERLVNEIMTVLEEQMDPLVAVIPNEPDLQDLYANARIVVSPATTETQMHIQVNTRDGDGFLQPVYEADLTIRITYTDKNEVTHHKELTGKTDINGIMIFKPIRQGYYDIEVMKSGYHTYQLLQHRVKKGQISRVVVELKGVGLII